MHLVGQLLDTLTQLPRELGELRVLLQQLQQPYGLFRGELLALAARPGKLLAMQRVGFGVGLVAVGLARLREQDQRRRIRGLQAESQVSGG